MDKILLVITTFNQLKYTEIFFENFQKLHISNCDLLVIDDASTDDTVSYCISKKIDILTKENGKGLTHSWNMAYKYFKEHAEYDYLIISNNDVIIPNGSLEELIKCHKKWPSICVVPLSTSKGCGHVNQQSILNYYTDIDESPECIQKMQDKILTLKNSNEMKNRKFLFDPFRMLMFNGFFFSLKRRIIELERPDGNLFNPEFLNFKNEDDFNWSILISNDEYPMLCKTSYIYHFKGKSFSEVKDLTTNDLEIFIKNRTK